MRIGIPPVNALEGALTIRHRMRPIISSGASLRRLDRLPRSSPSLRARGIVTAPPTGSTAMTRRMPAGRRRRKAAKSSERTVDRMLDKTSEELAVAKQLLKEKKGRAKRARSKLARENAKRAAKVVKKTLESIEDHQDLLLRTENARQNREVRS